MHCTLCTAPGGNIAWQDARCRVVLIAEPGYPGYCRVIWNTHVAELSDLTDTERTHCMAVVTAVERVLRTALRPLKINVASLGNQVPHLHWHIIPRFADDPHFPEPIWGTRQRAGVSARSGSDPAALAAALVVALDQLG
jgi:diadenosine tetraphosphate (Ap4A) HIT family hydrolase